MHLLFVQELFTIELIRALCWTLVHSLWQGLALAVVVGIVLSCTRKSGSATRYNILIALFALFVAGACCTFALEWHTANTLLATENIALLPAAATLVGKMPVTLPANGAVITGHDIHYYINVFVSYFNEHAALIVTIWFVFFSMKCIRIMAGLGHIQRIRHYKIHQPAAYWKNRITALSRSMHINKVVMLLESERVKVPLVVGFIKPVVLMPVGLLTKLPQDELEAILLHELAHIKRRDYLVNLLQSFAETIFFFNPAVLWISALIKEEREHCCDDMAIAQTSDPKKYINALVSFQEYNINAGYAMAFPGKKNHLLNRIKRIIGSNNKATNSTEKAFLAACFIIVTMLTWAFIQPAHKQSDHTKASGKTTDTIPVHTSDICKPLPPVIPTAHNTLPTKRSTEQPLLSGLPTQLTLKDTLQELNNATVYGDIILSGSNVQLKKGIATKQNIVIYAENGYLVITESDVVTALYHGNKRIPNEELAGYVPIIRGVIQLAKLNVEDKKRKTAAEGDSSYVAKAAAYAATARSSYTKQYPYAEQPELLARLIENQAQLAKSLSELDSQSVSLKINSKLNINLHPLNVQTAPLETRSKVDLQKFNANEDEIRQAAQLPKFRRRTGTETTKTITDDFNGQNTSTEKPVGADVIVDALVQEKVITGYSNDSLTYKLNNKVFIVNGVQQPVALHEKFKARFVKNPGVTYLYRWTAG